MTRWRKSTHCVTRECVEAGDGDGVTLVRDSADRDGPVLEFRSDVWAAFISSLRS